ncbi:electron transfer flavoprotein subunit alpha/FixB family protein [Thermogutta sp.]|uniref:electron transfer flavoprotein subunit alpha/FixB family protein n=1 Tax=Thermogutta sp. TaxID=1962930 RepID=UPI00321F7825
MSRRIAVPVEVYRGQITDLTRECLIAARLVARDEDEVVAYVFGEIPDHGNSALQLADRVVTLENGQVSQPVALAQAKLLCSKLDRKDTELVLVGSSSWGLDVGPLVAAFWGVPLVANCQGLERRQASLWATCRICAGKLLVDVEVGAQTAVVLLLPGSFLRKEVTPRATQPVMEKESVSSQEWDARVRFQRWIEPQREDVDITQAEILVAVGRGIERQENLEVAEELAEVLGGVVCGSRPVVDQGWLPPTRQVGKSGMIVKPKLYLAMGISGAPEHVEGMKDAELIVAINRDERAPIFHVAHYGIVADLFDVIPALKEALVARRQEA